MRFRVNFSIRGQLNSYMQIFFFSGVLLGYIGSSYLSYALNPWIMLALPVIFSVGFWFIPDTPQQLLRGNRIDVSMCLCMFDSDNSD